MIELIDKKHLIREINEEIMATRKIIVHDDVEATVREMRAIVIEDILENIIKQQEVVYEIED